MTSPTFTDLAYEQDAEGHYDLVIDEDVGDLAVTQGLDSALLVSLFSDRRARDDEVADPRRRRGWIGDLVAEVPGDVHGSGLWLYEQHRLDGETAVGVRLEAEAAVDWFVEERLVSTVQAEVVAVPADRQIVLLARIGHPNGSVDVKAFRLADATTRRILFKSGA